MCGILAAIGTSDLEMVRRQSALMRHRGPDERDIQLTSLGILSHERLSIIDLTTGKQPIRGTRNTWVIHNGEIYNHRQLHRDTLRGKYPCRTTSDSEVIVHLYEEFGSDFCNKLDGMFSFVVFDEDRQTYIAGRDPMGIKPLYYGKDKDGCMWFASEMKALCGVCDEFEAFPPGHYYTPEKGLVKYYQPAWENPDSAKTTNYKELRSVLEASVEKRLMSDVPFGVLLSGGLDSSLISAIAARLLRKDGKTLHSFSVGMSPDTPDIMAAREVAGFIGTQHHEVFFNLEDGLELLNKIVWHLESYDVTTIRASVPMYFLSKYITSKGIKMVLSGEGADEIFGGYLYFHHAPSSEEFHRECIRRVKLLSTADLLRADKSTMANGLEVRVPFLDKAFLQCAMELEPELKCSSLPGMEKRIEKNILRKAFNDKTNPYLPERILWRQKEQFSDGVGYGWIDGLQEFCNNVVSDSELALAEKIFPINPPGTKEAYYMRQLFHKHFPSDSAARTVKRWIPKWQDNKDPSGRANTLHAASLELVQS